MQMETLNKTFLLTVLLRELPTDVAKTTAWTSLSDQTVVIGFKFEEEVLIWKWNMKMMSVFKVVLVNRFGL